MLSAKSLIKRLPAAGILRRAYNLIKYGSAKQWIFPGSREYWEKRYARGGNSGAGSYGELAEFKADVLNAFVQAHDIKSVLEFGCGDGNQLTLSQYPNYVGVDVSTTAIDLCKARFQGDKTKAFFHLNDLKGQTAELTLSLDVIYHLVEDSTFDEYMRRLFEAASRYVIIYSSNTDENPVAGSSHVRHREFTKWVDANARRWSLQSAIPNKYSGDGTDNRSSFADFYIYKCLA